MHIKRKNGKENVIEISPYPILFGSYDVKNRRKHKPDVKKTSPVDRISEIFNLSPVSSTNETMKQIWYQT